MVGAVTDAFGSLSYALNVSAAMLAVGAMAAAFQKKLGRNHRRKSDDQYQSSSLRKQGSIATGSDCYTKLWLQIP